MNRSGALFSLVFVALAAVAGVCAETVDVQVRLTSDSKVLRRLDFRNKNGQPISGVDKIKAFDPQNASFTVESVAGITQTVPASSIKAIMCVQKTLAEPQSPAQTAAQKLVAQPGSAVKITVPQEGVKVDEAGNLVITTDTALTKKLEQAKNTKVTGTNPETISELKSVSYDPQKKMFSIEVQPVTYSVVPTGGSSSTLSGISKSQ
jgi:hypothetical protein